MSATQTTVAELAREEGVDPKIARQRLRKEYPDHEGRWTVRPQQRKKFLRIITKEAA